MGKLNKLIQQSERVYIYGSLSILLLVEFFMLLSIYFNYLDKTFLIVIMIANACMGFILFDKTFKERNELNKIKEVEYFQEAIRSIRNEKNKPKKSN